MMNSTVKEEETPYFVNDTHGCKVVSLPGERLFMIGGSSFNNGKEPSKQICELVDGKKEQKT